MDVNADEIEIPLLFEQNYLDQFHTRCGFPKHTRILCKSEFIAWWELKQNNTTRNVRNSIIEERMSRIPVETNVLRGQELKAGRALGSLICKNIEKGYSDYTLLNVFAGFNDEYDIAVVVDTRSPGNSLTIKKKKIYGFIISQFNEFKCKPNVFALNLVCVNHNPIKKVFSVNPNFGRKLVALYLCSVLRIKDLIIKKECVLELGGGVSNVSAFLTYIRLGFRTDIDMFKDKCITDVESLPMTIDLTKLNKNSASLTRSNRGYSMSNMNHSRSNRHNSPTMETLIINAAIGTHIIELQDDTMVWKAIIRMKDRDKQTELLKQIEQEYYDQLKPLVEAEPASYSSSVLKHFGLAKPDSE
jgi:hypothetical protein